MHDPKFEKEVQQKMEGLEFSPSGSVWTNIEKAVGKERTSRRAPFYFWRLAVPALALLGVGAFIYFGATPSKTALPGFVVTPSTKTAPSPETGKPSPGTTSSATAPAASAAVTPPTAATGSSVAATGSSAAATGSSATASSTTASSSKADNSSAAANSSTAANSSVVANSSATTSSSAALSFTPAATTAARVRRHAGPDRHGLRHNQPFKTQTQADETSTDADAGSSAATSAASIAASGSAATPAASTTPAASITSAASTTPSAERPGHTAFTYSPGLADFHRLSPRVKTSVVSTKKTPITIPALPKPKRSWEAGFTGSIGISSIQGPLVKKSAGPSSSAANYFSPVSLTTNGASNFAANGRAAGKQYVSDVRPDLSFSAGIIARKPLSSRWALTLGLGLHYYSSQLRLGYQDHYVPVPASASLITTAAAALPANASYYPAGDQQQFINKYYFLELPVALQWRINRSHLMPVFWEGGLSLAYLMGADAVYYNTHSGVYFKDDGAINKTQVNLSTSLMVGLPIRGVHIQAGPQLQYGLSNVVVTKVTNDQRFMYTGIRVVLMPGK